MVEQEQPRFLYNLKFNELINKVKLTVKFLDALKKHPCSYLLPTLNELSEESKKCRIFSEFTLVRNNTEQLIDALAMSGQTDAAAMLTNLNKSEVAWPSTYDLDMDVVPAKALRSSNSKETEMDANPRGRAIIFVTVKKLLLEAERFQKIYEKLLFEPVNVHKMFTMAMIKDELAKVALSKKKYNGNAFIMMFIGHGYEEKIVGWLPKGQKRSPSDEMPIVEIFNMFGEIQCRALREKTKIFIFNCCRSKHNINPKLTRKSDDTTIKCAKCKTGCLVCTDCAATTDTIPNLDSNWKRLNKQTYAIFACAEGWTSKFCKVPRPTNEVAVDSSKIQLNYYSVFGQALSHTIAQYSWYKSLYELFKMTIDRSDSDYVELAEKHKLTEVVKHPDEPCNFERVKNGVLQRMKYTNPNAAERMPQITMFAVSRELYFNPGKFKIDNDDLE